MPRGRPHKFATPSKTDPGYMKMYLSLSPGQSEKNRDRASTWQRRNRSDALKAVARGGPIVCSHCGCDDIRVIEINHVNGGGTKEIRLVGNQRLYKLIVDGMRAVDDLDLACRVCNALFFVEMKFPELKGRFQVKYST